MKKLHSVFLFGALALLCSSVMAETAPSPQVVEQASTEQQDPAAVAAAEEQQALQAARAFWESLNRQTGEIKLKEAPATLKVPESFYYLDSKDAERVLVEVWGNPPGSKTLGMLFPAGTTPFDKNAWAVTIQYQEEGYVSDEDANEMDYSELLKEMQSDTQAASKERVKAGYEAIELVNWAANPYYDKDAHKLHWAKELKFGEDPQHTLNYNIRILGRKGVLVLNFIAGMDQLKEIEGNMGSVLAVADFNQGDRYSDFNPDIDKVAAYGIGGLIAGKVLAKTGFLAVGLVLLKKFWIFIVAGIAALGSALFKRKKVEA